MLFEHIYRPLLLGLQQAQVKQYNGSTAENTFVIILTNRIPLILTGYEPGTLTTANITMASTTTAPTTYTSKYGTITLLNRTNYATWKSDITAVLLAANAFEITIGESLAPANLASQAGLDWIKRKGMAINLLYMSTSLEIRNTLTSFLNNQEIVAMWEHLAIFDLLHNSIYTLKLIQEFTLESFKAINTVESYTQRLLDY